MDPEKDPQKDNGGGAGENAPGTGPAKPPPWQVPKPELHPELLHPGPQDKGPQDPRQQDKGPQDPRQRAKDQRGKNQRGKDQRDKGQQDQGQQGQDFPQPSPIIDPFARERERELASAAARKKRSQRRTVVVGLGVTALLAGTITAIVASNEQEADYAQVCFNDETGERVEDTQCNSTAGRGGGLYAWYFYARGASVPAVGQNRSAYPTFTKTVPQGAKTSTGYSTKGGTVSRGGFGSSSKGGSTGG
ncbi:Tat pathway signal protein [Arthrobacter sp. ZGTC131]|uniref:Tat pathway signal protein n=1 Tax=Arthrobacter sp. ZGTC131 TaxID=2058898 RepID=UPI000CE33DDB|nr:Tat pathway signal protein [Arthrobacter sp. ZGTC131]